MGALVYTDDLIDCPTGIALYRLIDVCINFATKYNVNFNANKIKWMSYANDVKGARFVDFSRVLMV